MTLLNLELVSKAKLCPVGGFPHIVKDYPKMRNLPKIFLRSFQNVGLGVQTVKHNQTIQCKATESCVMICEGEETTSSFTAAAILLTSVSSACYLYTVH